MVDVDQTEVFMVDIDQTDVFLVVHGWRLKLKILKNIFFSLFQNSKILFLFNKRWPLIVNVDQTEVF